MARVELRHISKSYPGVQALDDIDLVIESGEFFTPLGPSGCGKTTLLRTVAGFNHQDSGAVWVAGRRIDDIPAHRRNIGLVFQDDAIVPHDQEEALIISDRIGVMQGGHVHQVGTPWEVYARPATLFVASFVGAMNVIADLAVGAGGTLALGAARLPVPALAGRDRVTLAIRLEDMTLTG